MKDNVFLDTNILVYAILQNNSNFEKTKKAINLLKILETKNVYAGTQILVGILKTNINILSGTALFYLRHRKICRICKK